MAPGVYALIGQPGETAPANLGHIGNVALAFGRIGSCADIDALARYFAAPDGHVRTLLAAGVGLAELPARCDLPEFAAWDGYTALHVQNANRAYLRMERESFNRLRSRCPRFSEQGLINFLDTPPQALQAVRTMAIETFVRRALIDARFASGI